jgi:hypothetical protein
MRDNPSEHSNKESPASSICSSASTSTFSLVPTARVKTLCNSLASASCGVRIPMRTFSATREWSAVSWREREPLPLDPRGDNRCPHAFMAGIGGGHLIDFSVGQVNRARQAIGAFGYLRLRLAEGWRRAAVFGLLAMFHDSSHGQLAGYFSMRLSAHTVRQNVQVQCHLNLKTVFVVASNASDVGARSGFYTQRGLIQGLLRLKFWLAPTRCRLLRFKANDPLKKRLTNRWHARNTL